MVNCNDTIRLSNVGVNNRTVMNGPAAAKTVTWRSAKVGSVLFFVEILRRLQERARDRKVLQRLDAQALKDVGMTRAELDQELSRPFWTGLPPRG